jgi:predicted type IV restriction endonuclease
MREMLTDIVTKLSNNFYKNEEHIRLSLVSRILHELGWDIWNPNEVNSEFPVLPQEDKTRVDLALFLSPYVPSVFIEVKAVGKLEGSIFQIENQLRDYNRNNTALFSIITDGRKWRFYYSQTGGEFSQKCFKILDLLEDDIDNVELSFQAFLSKSEISNGDAKISAEKYLKLSQKQRAMEDALSKARRMILKPPYPSLPQAIIQVVSETGFSISEKEATQFVKEFGTKEPVIESSSSRTSEKLNGKSIQPTDEHAPGKLREILKYEDLPIFFRYKDIVHNAYMPKQEYGRSPKVIYEGKEYSSPSAAAIAVIQKYTNRQTEDGWRVWQYKDHQTGDLIPIDNLR